MLITRRKEVPACHHGDTSTNDKSAITGKVATVEERRRKKGSTTDFLFSFLFCPITSCEIFLHMKSKHMVQYCLHKHHEGQTLADQSQQNIHTDLSKHAHCFMCNWKINVGFKKYLNLGNMKSYIVKGMLLMTLPDTLLRHVVFLLHLT